MRSDAEKDPATNPDATFARLLINQVFVITCQIFWCKNLVQIMYFNRVVVIVKIT
jgi:hypothetical protein